MSSRRVLKFGPSMRSRLRTLTAEPCGAGLARACGSRRSVSAKSSAPSRMRSLPWSAESSSICSLPQADEGAAARVEEREVLESGAGHASRRLYENAPPDGLQALIPVAPRRAARRRGRRRLRRRGAGRDRGARRCGVRLDEYRIVPQNVQVEEGRLRIVATNVGRLTHNLKIVKQDEDDLEERADRDRRHAHRAADESAAVTIEHLPAGRVPADLHDRQPRRPRPVRAADRREGLTRARGEIHVRPAPAQQTVALRVPRDLSSYRRQRKGPAPGLFSHARGAASVDRRRSATRRAVPDRRHVVTAPGPAGLTTNAFTSVSLDPPLVLVCFDNASRTLPAVRESGRFARQRPARRPGGPRRVFASKRVAARSSPR